MVDTNISTGAFARQLRTHGCGSFQAIAILFGLILATVASLGFAEGSRTLYPATYPAGGFRADLDLTDATKLYGGVTARRQFLYVYAKTGEFILLGSSNRANGGDVTVYNPQSFGTHGNETIPAAADFSCAAATPPSGSFSGGTLGQIVARANELAGPNSADNSATITDSYAPCAYRAPETGIYGVLFSVATSGGSGPSGSIDTLNIGNATVAAWDVTVRSSATSTVDTNARVFTYGFIAFTAGNGRPVYHTLFYATLDGSRYQQTMQGLDPNGYALWGNASGFLDNGQPLYKDLRGANATVDNGVDFGPGQELSAQVPQTPIFLSTIDPAGSNATQASTVLQALGIPLSPPVPQLSNPVFVGLESGNATYLGGGGTFTFSAQNDTSYQIVISADGVDFDPATTTNVTLTGLAANGNNAVPWNGLANDGTQFPVGTFTFQVIGRNGEIHFPIIDAEGNATGGPTLTKLNGTAVGDHTVYYDDRGYVTRNNQTIGTLNGRLCPANAQVEPTADHSLIGVDSNATTGGNYYRNWPGHGNTSTDCDATAGFGDAKGLDLWAYQQTSPQTNTVIIDTPPTAATVATTVSVPPVTYPNATVNGSFTFQNPGGTAANNVVYTAVIGTPGNCPTNLQFALLPTGVTFTYDASTCSVTLTNMPTTLTPGQSLEFNFSYTAPNSGSVPVTTTINSSNGGTATANGVTQIIVSDVTTTVTVPATAPSGSTVNGTIAFSNAPSATATANGVTYAAVIGTPGSCPNGVTFPTLPPGVTAVYDSATCQVTFSGLPASLNPGDIENIGFQYIGPLSGTVPVSSVITTTTPESNTANNTSSGQTTFTAPSPSLGVTKTSNGPWTVGQTVPAPTYTLSISNTGQAATIGTLSVLDTLPVGITAAASFSSGNWTCSTTGQNISCANSTDVLAATTGTSSISFPVSVTAAAIPFGATATVINNASIGGGGDPNNNGDPPPPGSCTPGDAHCGTTSTDVTALADLAIIKVASPASTYVNGQALNYTITVTNNGPSSLRSISVTDTVPIGLTVSAWSCAPGAGASAFADCDSDAPGTNASGTGNTISLIGVNLAMGDSLQITVSATVLAGATGAIVNTATVTPPFGTTCSTPPCTRTSTVTNTPAGSPALKVVKTASVASFTVGVPASYTLTATNVGSGPTTAPTTVADNIPSALTIGTPPAGCSAVGQAVSCTVAAGLAVGAASAVSFVIPVTPTNAVGASVTNTATISGGGDPGCPNPANANCSSTVVTPVSAPILTIVKTGPATATAGTNITYSITVTNTGAAAATNAVLSDPAPAGLTYISSLAPCATGFPCSLGTINVGQSIVVPGVTFAIGQGVTGSFVNVASVVSDQTTRTTSSVATVVSQGTAVAPTPASIDARWMLLAMIGLLTGIGAARIRARR